MLEFCESNIKNIKYYGIFLRRMQKTTTPIGELLQHVKRAKLQEETQWKTDGYYLIAVCINRA